MRFDFSRDIAGIQVDAGISFQPDPNGDGALAALDIGTEFSNLPSPIRSLLALKGIGADEVSSQQFLEPISQMKAFNLAMSLVEAAGLETSFIHELVALAASNPSIPNVNWDKGRVIVD